MVFALLWYVDAPLTTLKSYAHAQFVVFGASLTIFGTLLISPEVTASATPFPDRLEEGCVSIRKASEALRQLDDGNQLAMKCADYLSETSRLLDKWRKYHVNFAFRCYILFHGSFNTLRFLGSSTTLGDMNNGELFRTQDILQSGGYSPTPFQGTSFNPSQIGSDAMFMADFALNDLEMGQFFLPDDFLHRSQPSKNKTAQ